ncbi:MAG: hypothetical protein WBI10_08205 [Syntrophales bacterium]
MDLDEPWRRRLGLGFQDAEELLGEHGLTERWMTNKSIGALLQVEVIRLEAMQDNPYVVLKPGHQGLFQFAVAQGLVALDSPLVLDPMYRDFSSDRIEKALRSVGGKAAPITRARKRR